LEEDCLLNATEMLLEEMRQFTLVNQGRTENEFKLGLEAATYFSAGRAGLNVRRTLAGLGRQFGTTFLQGWYG
jgi:hypothetical protein